MPVTIIFNQLNGTIIYSISSAWKAVCFISGIVLILNQNIVFSVCSVFFNFLIKKNIYVIFFGFFSYAFLCLDNLSCFHLQKIRRFQMCICAVLHFILRSQVQQIKIIFQWIQHNV